MNNDSGDLKLDPKINPELAQSAKAIIDEFNEIDLGRGRLSTTTTGKTQKEVQKKSIEIANQILEQNGELGLYPDDHFTAFDILKQVTQDGGIPRPQSMTIQKIMLNAKQQGVPKNSLEPLKKELMKTERDQVILTGNTLREAAQKARIPQHLFDPLVDIIPENEFVTMEIPKEQTVYESRPQETAVENRPSAPTPLQQGQKIDFTGEITRTAIDKVTGKAVDKGTSFISKSISQKVATKLSSSTLARGVTALAVKLGLSATGVGIVVAAAVAFMERFGRNAASWLKRNSKYLVAGLGALLGFTLGGPFFGLLGGAGGLLLAGGITGGISGAVGSLASVIAGVLGATAAVTAAPIIFTLVVIPILVIFIVFIINTGAYLTPPSDAIIGSQFLTSRYAQVEKVVSPEGPFENGQVPEEITYTVTITPLLGSIIDISFSDTCRVTKEDQSPGCSGSIPEEVPDVIDSSSPFTYSYTKNLSGDEFSDSFVSNTFSITAGAPSDEGGETFTASDTSIIKIGNPPEECPEGWPVATGTIWNGAGPGGIPTHSNLEAIDIATNSQAIPVYTTHPGITRVEENTYSGKIIRVESSCNGILFTSNYVHLSLQMVADGTSVTKGQQIGMTGHSGTSGGNVSNTHLHYDFRLGSRTAPQRGVIYPNIPNMNTPFIPVDLRRGCSNRFGVPCNYSF